MSPSLRFHYSLRASAPPRGRSPASEALLSALASCRAHSPPNHRHSHNGNTQDAFRIRRRPLSALSPGEWEMVLLPPVPEAFSIISERASVHITQHMLIAIVHRLRQRARLKMCDEFTAMWLRVQRSTSKYFHSRTLLGRQMPFGLMVRYDCPLRRNAKCEDASRANSDWIKTKSEMVEWIFGDAWCVCSGRAREKMNKMDSLLLCNKCRIEGRRSWPFIPSRHPNNERKIVKRPVFSRSNEYTKCELAIFSLY